MSLATYLNHESFFRLWGTTFSKDRIAIGPPPNERNYGDTQVLRELTDQPLEANAGYLSYLAAEWGAAPFARSEPGSYRQWALAAAAYAELAREWPEHARTVPASYMEALYGRGSELHGDLERIANAGTREAPKANGALFDAFLKKHEQLKTKLLAAIKDEEAKDPRPDRLPQPGLTIDPFGGREQEVSSQHCDRNPESRATHGRASGCAGAQTSRCSPRPASAA